MSKFKEGQKVYAIENPTQQLFIRRFLDQIYYCRVVGQPDHRELAFFERELTIEKVYSLAPKEIKKDDRSEYLYWN